MIDSDDIASVLVPVNIRDAQIAAMTAGGVALPEDANPMWVSTSTYAIGDRVYSPATHRVYESLKASNAGKDPTDPINRTTATGVGTWWYDLAPTNKYAMFDGLINTKTVAASPFVITLRPGAFNGMGMLGIEADSVVVTTKDAPGGTVINTYEDDLEGSAPADYYEYFFAPFKPQTQFIVTGVEPYSSSEVTITMTKATGPVKVGMYAIGTLKPLGATERGAIAEPKSYDYYDEDAYGNVKVVRRPSATGLSLPIKLDLEDADSVLETVQGLLGVPVLVIGSTAQFHTRLTTFGLISGRMDYSEYPYRVLNLTVKGYT